MGHGARQELDARVEQPEHICTVLSLLQVLVRIQHIMAHAMAQTTIIVEQLKLDIKTKVWEVYRGSVNEVGPPRLTGGGSSELSRLVLYFIPNGYIECTPPVRRGGSNLIY